MISKGISREIRKMEVRFNDFMISEAEFVKKLRVFIESLKRVNNYLEELVLNSEEIRGELLHYRMEIVQKLGDVLKLEGKLEHEKSHLWESIGGLILVLEKDFQRISSHNDHNE